MSKKNSFVYKIICSIFILALYIYVGEYFLKANWAVIYPLIGPMLVAFLGWWITHSFSVQQDSVNRKNELVINYLIKAYRTLEYSCERTNHFVKDENARELEAAMAEIMLFGTNEEQRIAHDFMKKIVGTSKNGKNTPINIEELLEKLRERLREELNLEKAQMPIKRLRLIKSPTK